MKLVLVSFCICFMLFVYSFLDVRLISKKEDRRARMFSAQAVVAGYPDTVTLTYKNYWSRNIDSNLGKNIVSWVHIGSPVLFNTSQNAWRIYMEGVEFPGAQKATVVAVNKPQ